MISGVFGKGSREIFGRGVGGGLLEGLGGSAGISTAFGRLKEVLGSLGEVVVAADLITALMTRYTKDAPQPVHNLVYPLGTTCPERRALRKCVWAGACVEIK